MDDEMLQQLARLYRRYQQRLRIQLEATEDPVEQYRLIRALYRHPRVRALMPPWSENEPLDNESQKAIIKSSHLPAEDGGPGSGNHEHEGVPGQVGGSAPSGGAEGVTKFPTSGGKMKITSDLKVKASKSGKTTVTIKKGSEIEGIYSFAGKGSDKNLVVSGRLSKQFGGKPGEWGHLCGFATVVAADGSEYRREIHWFEHDDIGQIKFKVKIRQGGTE